MQTMEGTMENRSQISGVMGRAYVSRNGKGFLYDEKAEEIAVHLTSVPNQIKPSQHLAIFLGSRARYFDRLAERFLFEHPNCIVLHLGCGLDARALRIKNQSKIWYDVDFPEVIALRKQFFEENENYKMIATDITDLSWLNEMECSEYALVIAEGLTMFLTADENVTLIYQIRDKFAHTEYLFDAYSDQIPILLGKQDSGVREKRKTICWGLSDPGLLERIPGVMFVKSHNFNESGPLIAFPLLTRIQYRILCGKNSTNRYYKIYQYKIIGSRAIKYRKRLAAFRVKNG